MNLAEKEQILHKVVAASAFLFALSILPVAQFALQRSYLEPSKNSSNQVAGVASDKQTVLNNVSGQTREECLAAKEKELSELATWQTKTSKALENAYNKKVEPYEEALAVLTGTPSQIEQDRQALNGLIGQEKEAYLKKVSDFEKAAVSQKEAIESRVCPAE